MINNNRQKHDNCKYEIENNTIHIITIKIQIDHVIQNGTSSTNLYISSLLINTTSLELELYPLT